MTDSTPNMDLHTVPVAMWSLDTYNKSTHSVVTDRDDRTDDARRNYVSAPPAPGDLDPRESITTEVSQRLEFPDDDVENCDEQLQPDPNFIFTEKELSYLSSTLTLANDSHQPHAHTYCAGEYLILNGVLTPVPPGAHEHVVVTDGTDATRSTEVSIASSMSTPTSAFGDLDPGNSFTTEVSQRPESQDDDIENCDERPQMWRDTNVDTLRESLSLEQDVIDIQKCAKAAKKKKAFPQAKKKTRQIVPKKQASEFRVEDLGRLQKSTGIVGKSPDCGATTLTEKVGEKPFKCEKCGRGFLHASELAAHGLTHATPELHRCDLCGDYFALLSTFTKHKLLHAGECPTIHEALHTVEDVTQETVDKNVEIADDTRNDLNVDIGNGNVNSGLQLSAQNSIGILSENGTNEDVENSARPKGHVHPNCENLNLSGSLATSLTDADAHVTNAMNTNNQTAEVEIENEYDMSVEKRKPLTQGTTKTRKQKQLILRPITGRQSESLIPNPRVKSRKKQPSERRVLGENLESSQDLRLRKSTVIEEKSSDASTRSPQKSGRLAQRKRSPPVEPAHHIVSDGEESSDESLIVSAKVVKKRKTLSQVKEKVGKHKELELPKERPSKRGVCDRGENSQISRDLIRKPTHTMKKKSNVDLPTKASRKSSRLSKQNGEKAGNYEMSGMSCSELSSSESEMEESISHKRKKKTTQKKGGRLECEICGFRFLYPSHLDKHMLTHTKQKSHKCGICQKSFARQDSLIRHELGHTGEKFFECDVCGRRFTQAGNLAEHKFTHTGGRPKPFTCNICGRGCGSSSELGKHKKIHTGEKSYECDLCQKRFTVASSLTRHKLTHAGRKDFNCDQCDKRFGLRFHLNQHKLIHTGEKPHKCVMCDKCFTQRPTLNQHIRTHTGERAHKCDVCDKDFSDQSTLAGHKLIHTGVKAHECKVCQKSFISKSALTRHKRRMHAGVKPHQCRMCNKSFVENYELARHMLTHTGERPYRCDVCKMGFGDQSYLTKHGLTHTGVKPHKCDICQKCFRLKYALTQHETIHTAEKKYKCELCQMCFRLKKGLTQHKKNKHTARHPKVPTWPEDGPPPPGQWVK